MNVLFVSNDPRLFEKGSAARMRMRAYAQAITQSSAASGEGQGTLHVISRAKKGTQEVTEGALTLHPVHVRAPFHLWVLTWRAHSLIKRAHIDVVSAQDPFEYGYLAWKAHLLTSAKLHIQLHTDPFTDDFARTSLVNRVRRGVMPFVLRHADRIRAVSQKLKSEVEQRYHPRARVSVLPIYADLTSMRALMRTPEKGNLLWFGRFEKEKDPMFALEVLAAARAGGIDARLTMLGTGRLERAVAARAKVRGLLPHLQLRGHADPAPYLAKAELVLATSRYEGYGLAILEALTARVPVLSTDVGIAREAGAIVAERSGFIQKAVELLRAGPPVPPPVPDPYPSFDAYVKAYVEDLRQA